jgi:hypothetical protein
MRFSGAILFFIFYSNFSFSQETLEILSTSFGSLKRHHIYVNDPIEYKLKGEFKFHKSKIIHMEDSTILFENYQEVKLSELKCLRFEKSNFLITKFRRFFLMGGIMFMTLNTCNNLILDHSPVINQKAGIISAALFTTGLLLKRMEYKKVRITRNKIVRIVNFSYQNLNRPY